jgi:hypothetical protein
VHFSGTPFHSFLNDLPKFLKAFGGENSTALDSIGLIESLCPGPNKPPMIGCNLFNDIFLLCIDPKVTGKIYLDVNKYHSKPQTLRTLLKSWIPTSIIF